MHSTGASGTKGTARSSKRSWSSFSDTEPILARGTRMETIDGIPVTQWINVMVGVRYTKDECLTEQRDLVDNFRNPIVRANEIRHLVADARP